MTPNMSTEEYIRKVVASLPPLTDAQVERAARILASVETKPPRYP